MHGYAFVVRAMKWEAAGSAAPGPCRHRELVPPLGRRRGVVVEKVHGVNQSLSSIFPCGCVGHDSQRESLVEQKAQASTGTASSSFHKHQGLEGSRRCSMGKAAKGPSERKDWPQGSQVYGILYISLYAE